VTLQEAKLTLETDVNSDGGREEGVFRLYGDPEVQEWMRTGFIVGGRGSTVNSIVQNAFGTESRREGIYIDLGGGAHGFTVNWRNTDDLSDINNNDITWGDDSYGTPSAENATGEDPKTQSNIFFNYLTTGEYDSRGGDKAIFEYGEWSSGGVLDPLEVVVVEQPQLTATADQPGFYTGQLTVVAAEDISRIGHSEARDR
jgi:hypothetical protein